MITDENLQQEVHNAIKWERSLCAAEIGVAVKEGVVTLSGTVDNYCKKATAEDAVAKLSGVKAIVECLKVKLYPSTGLKDDDEIAIDILTALRLNWDVPDDIIKIKIEDGWVTLEGTVRWNHQREAAYTAAGSIKGVKGIFNNIIVLPEIYSHLKKESIEDALKRNWSVKGDNIKVQVSGNHVKLDGKVESLYQKNEAGKIAWNAPGAGTIENNLVVNSG